MLDEVGNAYLASVQEVPGFFALTFVVQHLQPIRTRRGKAACAVLSVTCACQGSAERGDRLGERGSRQEIQFRGDGLGFSEGGRSSGGVFGEELDLTPAAEEIGEREGVIDFPEEFFPRSEVLPGGGEVLFLGSQEA